MEFKGTTAGFLLQNVVPYCSWWDRTDLHPTHQMWGLSSPSLTDHYMHPGTGHNWSHLSAAGVFGGWFCVIILLIKLRYGFLEIPYILKYIIHTERSIGFTMACSWSIYGASHLQHGAQMSGTYLSQTACHQKQYNIKGMDCTSGHLQDL